LLLLLFYSSAFVEKEKNKIKKVDNKEIKSYKKNKRIKIKN